MKSNRIITGILSLAIASVAYAGNENGGGGNTLPSTPASRADIKSNLKTIKDQAYAGFLRLKFAVTNPDYLNEQGDVSSFKPIIEKLIGTYSQSEIENKFYSFFLDIKDNASCYDQGVERDASADPVSNTICVSVKRLSNKEIPFHDLSLKLTALMIHEVGHLLALNEHDAEVLQTAFESYGKMITPAQIFDYKRKAAFNFGYDTPDLIAVILKMIEIKESDTKLCFKIGQLDMLMFGDLNMVRNSFTIFGLSIFNEAVITNINKAWGITENLYTYCGFSPESSNQNPIQVGDQKALKNAVQSLEIEMKALFSDLGKAPFALNCEPDDWQCQ